MKVKNLLLKVLILCGLFSFVDLTSQNNPKQTPTFIQGPPQRTCGTDIPSQQWEELLQKKVAEFLAANPEITESAKQGSGNSTQAVYTIPVIIHVIHGGQAVGTFPNLAQGQLNSQIQVLNDDFAGVGQNVGNYPATAFTTWATNTIVSAASKDALARIKIANTGVTFCLALQDSLGNTLTEPGIHRVNYNTLPALTGTFTSKNPANAVYNTPGKLQGFINGYIKPNTIWNVRKYMNIWVSDQNAAVGLLGYATFPPLSGLTGIPGGVGTATTDGFWSWSAAFGSSTIFPGGAYAAPYDKGRTCTHEIGHWVGLRHIWGDGTCLTDYCNDTPPASSSNFGNPAYPLKSGSCAGPPSNAPNGEMFMNFMDYTDDLAMYMFTNDQRTRLQTAMMNSPYRNQLGTHGLCSVPAPTANFTIVPNPICAGQTATITDMSTGSPGAWSYTMTGGSPSTSTLQSPTVTYTAAGIYSITLIASNGGGNSTPIIKTITVNAVPVVTITATPTIMCAGNSVTLIATGAATYSWNTGPTTSSIIVSPTVATTYTVTGANGTCIGTRTISIGVSANPTVNITPTSATICSGNSTTLTGSGAVNYTWTPGGMTTAAVVVSPAITTTYTLTGANAAGCTSTRTVQVTVNTTPTVTAVANPAILCSGGSSTLTVSGAATYTWMPGSLTGATIVVTPTANTTYTVTGANGTCSNTGTVSITISTTPTVNINPPSATVCIGNSTTFFGSGATNYTWMPGSINTSSIAVSPTATTIYTLTGSNASGCSSTRTTQVVVNPLPTVTISSNPLTICPGSTATLTASGSGPGPFTYSWSTGATSAAITSSTTGVYTASVTNGNGCSGSLSYSLNAAAGLTINIAATPTSVCAGGSVTLTASGAATYTWNTGPTTSSIVVSPTTTTNYTVNGTSGSCTGSNTISITVNPNPTVTAVANPSIMCAGQSSTLTAGGAATYSWSTGSTSVTTVVSPTIATSYTVTGTNSFGCSATRTVGVFIMSPPVVSVVSSPTSICTGGSSTLTANGALTYTWNTSATTSVIVVSPSITTIYTVTGSTGSGCTATQTVQLTVNTAPTINVVASPTAICAGGTTSLNASGASTYSWSTGATTSGINVSPTVTTTYTVTGSNATCSNTTTLSVTVNAAPSVTITSSGSPICAGTSATLTGSGATNYTWMPGGMTTTSVVVSPTVNTTYTLTGSNGGGCTGTRTITINVQAAPVITVTANPLVICTGNASTLTANGSGPPGPFTYSWSTGATSSAITTTVPGVYTATFTNGNGCKAAQSVTITSGSPVVTAAASQSAICSGATATISASGATTYSWNTGGTTSSIIVSPTTTTTYTVIGTTGSCSGSQTVTLIVNSNPTVNVVASPTLVCTGSTSTLTASGATTYSWSTAATTSVIAVTPITTTIYTVTGSNAAGCSVTRTVSVNTIATPGVSVSTTSSVICSGSSATITASGAPTYSWNTGATTAVIVVTPTATTNYTVIGSNGSCTDTKTISLTVNTTPTVTVIATPSIICSGNTSNLTASGASTYSWSTGAVTSGISVSPSVTATYTVTGSNGSCSNTRTVTISVISGPSISVSGSSSLICVGQSVTLTASGSSTTYSWSTGSNSISISVSPTVTTNYTVNGTNAAGCSSSSVITQSVSPCTGITTVNSADETFAVYPNPNNGEFTITTAQLSENVYLEIYNNTGQLIRKQIITDNKIKVNMAEHSDGIYHIRITKNSMQLYKSQIIKD